MRLARAALLSVAVCAACGCHGTREGAVDVPAEVRVRPPANYAVDWTVHCEQEGDQLVVFRFALANGEDGEVGVPARLGICFSGPREHTAPTTLDGDGPVVVESVTRPDGSVFWPAVEVTKRGPRAVREEDLCWMAGRSAFRPPEARVLGAALGVRQKGLYTVLLRVRFPLHYMDLAPLGEREDRVWVTAEDRCFAVPFVWR
jgi:hypothetical protein